ncbi:type II toxin-antitoxin system HigB family toxin [Flavobacterium segetis]
MIINISYDYQMVWIRFIETHVECDKSSNNEI